MSQRQVLRGSALGRRATPSGSKRAQSTSSIWRHPSPVLPGIVALSPFKFASAACGCPELGRLRVGKGRYEILLCRQGRRPDPASAPPVSEPLT